MYPQLTLDKLTKNLEGGGKGMNEIEKEVL